MHFQTIARILADNHNLDVVYSDAVDTFAIRQDPQTKRLTVILASRVLKASDGNDADLAMMTRGAFAHEALGHGRHSDFSVRSAKTAYGRSLHFLLEDIRIEHLAPEEYPGAARILREFMVYLEANRGFWQPKEGCVPEESLAIGLLRRYRTDILGQPLPAPMTNRLVAEAKAWLGADLFDQVDALARSACFAATELEVVLVADEIVELLKHAKKPQEPEPPQPQPNQPQEGEPSDGEPDAGDRSDQPNDPKEQKDEAGSDSTPPDDQDDKSGTEAPAQPDGEQEGQPGEKDAGADEAPHEGDEPEPEQDAGGSSDHETDQGGDDSSTEDGSSDDAHESDGEDQGSGNPGDSVDDDAGDGSQDASDEASETDEAEGGSQGNPGDAKQDEAAEGEPSSDGESNEAEAEPGSEGNGAQPSPDQPDQANPTQSQPQSGAGNPTQQPVESTPSEATPTHGTLVPTSAPLPDEDDELDFSDRINVDVDYHDAIRDALKDMTVEVPGLEMRSSDLRDAVAALEAKPLAAEVKGIVQKMKAGLDQALRSITDDEDDIESDIGRLDMSRIARIASGVEKQPFLTDGAPGAGLSTELLVLFDKSWSMEDLGTAFLQSLVYATGQALATYAPDVRFNLAFFNDASQLVHTADHHWTAAHGAKVAAMYVPDGGTRWAQSALPLVPLLVKSRKQRKVFLTVSDGDINADKYPEALQEMKEHHIEASFVCIGDAVPEGLKGVSCETNAAAFAKAFVSSILSAVSPQFV